MKERRKSPRFDARFDVLYSTGPSEGAGEIVEISHTGARMEGVSLKPEIGTEVRLYVFVQPVAPFELIGSVARVTDTGFSVHYELADAEIRRLVDDVAAAGETPD